MPVMLARRRYRREHDRRRRGRDGHVHHVVRRESLPAERDGEQRHHHHAAADAEQPGEKAEDRPERDEGGDQRKVHGRAPLPYGVGGLPIRKDAVLEREAQLGCHGEACVCATHADLLLADAELKDFRPAVDGDPLLRLAIPVDEVGDGRPADRAGSARARIRGSRFPHSQRRPRAPGPGRLAGRSGERKSSDRCSKGRGRGPRSRSAPRSIAQPI